MCYMRITATNTQISQQWIFKFWNKQDTCIVNSKFPTTKQTDLHCVCFPTRCLSIGKYCAIVARQHICLQHHITSMSLIVTINNNTVTVKNKAKLASFQQPFSKWMGISLFKNNTGKQTTGLTNSKIFTMSSLMHLSQAHLLGPNYHKQRLARVFNLHSGSETLKAQDVSTEVSWPVPTSQYYVNIKITLHCLLSLLHCICTRLSWSVIIVSSSFATWYWRSTWLVISQNCVSSLPICCHLHSAGGRRCSHLNFPHVRQ